MDLRAESPVRWLTGVLAVMLSFSSPGTLFGQAREGDVSDILASREVLERRLADMDAAARSRAYSTQLRERARQAAERYRERLREGDFRVGDRIALRVEEQVALSDTFVVLRDRVLELPVVGAISLRGVLRAELESHLTEELGRFLRDPVVQARSLIRVSVLGAVVRPGFHMFPPEAPLTETIMSVGGPAGRADIEAMRISRGGDVLWQGAELRDAVRAGLTLDELDLRAGDEIFIPEARAFSLEQIRVFALAFGAIITITQIF